jgi:hypothetical protein
MSKEKSGMLGTAFLSTALVVVPMVSMEGCGLLKQLEVISPSKDDATKKFHSEMWQFVGKLYNLAHDVRPDLEPLYMWKRHDPDFPRFKNTNKFVVVYEGEETLQDMEGIGALAKKTSAYYQKQLFAGELQGEALENAKQGAGLSSRFKVIYKEALQAGIFTLPSSQPSAGSPDLHSSQDRLERGM